MPHTPRDKEESTDPVDPYKHWYLQGDRLIGPVESSNGETYAKVMDLLTIQVRREIRDDIEGTVLWVKAPVADQIIEKWIPSIEQEKINAVRREIIESLIPSYTSKTEDR